MPSRQDQLHSYQFMVQRVVAALVLRSTDPAQSPFRRAAGATLAGVLTAVIAVSAVALYGAVVGGSASDWRDPSAVIVERESGARYIYRDERLHPVLNYASALLIVESAIPRTVLVSRTAIEGVPRGVPLGIPDAPDSLPPAERLLDGPWTVCSVSSTTRHPRPRSVLLVGTAPAGGAVLSDDGVLARHPDGTVHLIWRGRRYLVRDPGIVFAALGWTGARPVPVAPALLNALPAGADLAPPPISGRGQRSAGVDGARIGDVFAMTSLNGDRQYAVVKRDGLAAVTEVQAALLLTAFGQDEPIDLPGSRFASLPREPDLVPTGDAAPPTSVPRLVSDEPGTICGTVHDEGGIAKVRLGAEVPEPATDSATGARTTEGGVLADHIVVEPGRAALVESVAAPGATGGTVCVISDLGRRYPVAGPDVLSLLGYGEVEPLRLPAGLVALVPGGDVLDPTLARSPVVRPA